MPQPLVARVLNSAGQPVSGQIVNFVVLKGGGSVFAGAAITSASGIAQERWTLGKSVADSQVVEARAVDASTGERLVFARFIATAVAGAPATMEKNGGDTQSASAGAALPESLLVLVSDVYGNHVSGASVSWVVESGDGTVSSATTVTTTTGFASTKWTLGSEVGSQSVRAAAGTSVSSLFTATATQEPPLLITKSAGDSQTASPGSAVTVRPSVRVTDSNGNPRTGVTVTFAVTAGGGGVTGATAITDAAGLATVGSWVLGPQPGTNTLSATASTGGSVTFRATAVESTPDITLSIAKPGSGLVGDTVDVQVNVTSRLQITSVRAALGGRTATLVASNPGVWTGTLFLDGVARDTMTLVATATDVNGTVAQAIRAVTHDRRPRLAVTSPSTDDVARPSLPVNVACNDDDPNGCTILVRLSDGTVLAGPSAAPLQTTISLAAYDGRQVELLITARDSKDQTTTVLREVFVESSTRLQLLGTAEGRLYDVSDTRLFWSSSSQPAAGIRHIQTGASDTIVATLGGTVYRAHLTPTGAAFSVSSNAAPFSQLYIWKNEMLTTKALNSTSSFAGAGTYIIYTVDQNNSSLYRMDLATGGQILISGSVGNSDNGVAENGDVAYWSNSYDIFRYRSGDTLRVTSETDTNWNVYPLTDGINIVFLRQNPCCSEVLNGEIWLYDGTSLSLLSPARTSSVSQYHDYAVNGGWTAFTRIDASAHAQVWTRSPTGSLRSVSGLGTSSLIRAVGTDGSVVFDSGTDRYFAGPSSAPVRVGSSAGNVLWRDGRFVVLIGNSAFTVNP